MSAPPIPPTSLGVTVRGLKKSLGGIPVLRGIDLDIQPGELFVIMGPSGSGKTVFLKHLIGLETPDAGEIRVDGESILSSGVMDRYRMAMVFQSGALFNSLTVEENVGLYLTEHRLKPASDIARIVSEKLELVGLSGTGHKMPSELSGGMKKRVAIARALVVEPQLILYDEPTSELDPVMATTVGREIVRLNRQTSATSIVVTHDRDLAFGIAHRMVIMLDGTIRATGTPEEIRACKDPEVRELLDADFNIPNA